MRAWRAAGQERWTPEHHRRDNARSVAAVNLKRGKLERQPCCECGSEVDVEMHHADYDKPLEVRWLCRRCHLLIPKDQLL